MKMEEKIKQHFNGLFAEAPKTRRTLELKQEMLQNALDKYHDLRADGYAEEDAYQNVVNSIGDVSGLLAETEETDFLNLPEKDRKKRAMLKAVSVGMFIFAGVVFFFFGTMDSMWGSRFDFETFGLCLAALICIPPTIMNVYVANMYPNHAKKEKQDMVEEYRERRYANNKEKEVRKSVNAIIWTVAIIAYFAISFSTYAWYITWIIFLIALCIQLIVGLVFNLKRME